MERLWILACSSEWAHTGGRIGPYDAVAPLRKPRTVLFHDKYSQIAKRFPDGRQDEVRSSA
jgi:hypothetical protein